MNDAQATQFSHAAAEKKCPSCGETLLSAGGYLFCEREHGTRKPKWRTFGTPVATRTAKAGRFTIEGELGFWRLAPHRDKELTHEGPEEGSVVASILRYKSPVATAVVFVRGRKPRQAGSVPYQQRSGRQLSRSMRAPSNSFFSEDQ
jgi:hypothetical protein